VSKKKINLKKSKEFSGESWQIIYTGFILILLCFFIMLSSFSTMEEAKIMRFVRAFVSAISILPGGQKFDSATAVMPISTDMLDNKSELAKIFEKLELLIGEHGLTNDVSISYSSKGLVMRLSEHTLFDVGVVSLSAESISLLQKIGAVISKTSYRVQIEGHTDNLPINTEKFPSNWELSTARAVNVLRYFIDVQKISPHRLFAVGFGEYQPLVSNDSPTQRAKNRRVEIIFLVKD
jgi:chemotaxis protein MotB